MTTELYDVSPIENCTSIFTKTALPKRSKHYVHVDSEQIVQTFAENNWVPHQASQVKNRIPEYREFSKHLVTFRNPDIATVNGIIPQIVLVNSHDGTTSARLMAGLYRFLCANGLIVAENEFATRKIRHSTDALEQIADAIKQIVHTVPLIVGKSEQMNEIVLNKVDQLQLSSNVIERVWSKKDQNKPFEPAQLIEARRSEDMNPTLWNTYNAIQENLMKGGLVGTTSTNRQRVMRGITNIDRSVEVNQILWEETDKFLLAA